MNRVDSSSWEKMVKESPVPVLVYYGQPWCPACKTMRPVVEELSREESGFKVFEADRSLFGPGQIRNIPTCLAFKQGVETARFVGVQRKGTLLDVLREPSIQASRVDGEFDMTAKKNVAKASEMKSAPKGAFDWMGFLLPIAMQILAKLADMLKEPKALAAASQGTSCENCAEDLREAVSRLTAVADKLDAGTCDHACCEEVNCVQACLLLTAMKMHNCCE